MLATCFLLWLMIIQSQSIDCPTGQQPCGTNGCYDPNVQGCLNGGTSIQCINSCNGTCYSSSQYCYNNIKVCNNGESVCNATVSYWPPYITSGLTCYNSSQLVCSNNTLCDRYYSCGTRCLPDYYTACANNQTFCPGYSYWNSNVRVCGSQQRCYDMTNSSCVNGTTVCPISHTRLCGGRCWDPNAATCINGTILRCINSCNGTCYSSSQYCYNNIKVCNNSESVCNATIQLWPYNMPTGLVCYNSSQAVCSNNSLCERYYSCGTRCLPDYYTTCVNNQTFCPGYYYWNTNMRVCGSQQQCYDMTNSSCVNGTTVCPISHTRLCGGQCWNPAIATCINNTVLQCNYSCNGTCYSSSQYCHNNIKVCNNGEAVCNATVSYWPPYITSGLTCYNSSQRACSNNTLCELYYSCRSRCLPDYNTACANNQTLCPGYGYWNTNMRVCGSQQQCYDMTNSSCVNGTTVCSIGSDLCSGLCYNPQAQYCVGGNNTIFCLNNPASANCPFNDNTTTPRPIVSGTCCGNKNCSTNADCCQQGALDCQCYRHQQNDTYGSCLNPNITPMCGDSCPVQSRCRVDSDCCRCQCAGVTFTDSDGNPIATRQCVAR
jgi:hypothetical protein